MSCEINIMGQFRQEETPEDHSNLFNMQENQKDQGLLQEKSYWYRKHAVLNNVQWEMDQENAACLVDLLCDLDFQTSNIDSQVISYSSLCFYCLFN